MFITEEKLKYLLDDARREGRMSVLDERYQKGRAATSKTLQLITFGTPSGRRTWRVDGVSITALTAKIDDAGGVTVWIDSWNGVRVVNVFQAAHVTSEIVREFK